MTYSIVDEITEGSVNHRWRFPINLQEEKEEPIRRDEENQKPIPSGNYGKNIGQPGNYEVIRQSGGSRYKITYKRISVIRVEWTNDPD